MKKKIKRLATSLLPVAPNRVGDCNRCGECCKLPYPCPFLRYDADGLSMCAIYTFRPPSCRKYPRTAEENLTPQVCGFSFEPTSQVVEVGLPKPWTPGFRRNSPPDRARACSLISGSRPNPSIPLRSNAPSG